MGLRTASGLRPCRRRGRQVRRVESNCGCSWSPRRR